MHNHDQNNQVTTYSIKNFYPLIIIFCLIIFFTMIMQAMYGFSIDRFMRYFMGSFFIIFGAFKIINLAPFAQAYREYDIIAQRSVLYAYLYPFIECTLGIMYLAHYQLFIANLITVVLMIVSSIGVFRALLQKRAVTCACLGAVFKIPMTYVTLIEDLLMGLMALIMLIRVI